MTRSLCLRLLWLSVPVAGASWARAADAPQTLLDRKEVSLDGEWKTIIDPYETGYYDYRWQPYDQQHAPPPAAYFMDAKPRSSADLVEYDFDASASLRVPGDWNTQRRELFYYEGSVWYRRTFTSGLLQHGSRAFLRFGAANYGADVYLNGRKLGTHIGGFTPFSFEVTEALEAGDNTIVVRVDNRRTADAVPTLDTDWWNYGGLTRDVRLVSVPSVFVASHRLHLESVSTRIVSGEVRLDGAHGREPVEIELPELAVPFTATTDATGRAVFRFQAPASLEVWSPDHPKLYEVRFRHGSDAVADLIGLRTIAVKGRQILLNDRPIFLRGVSMHDEFALGGAGRVVSAQQSRTLLSWAKELGCNYVRLAHYPHNEETVRLADRLGLLVWSEVPVYWTIAWTNEDTYRNAEAQLTAMIGRDCERACVILWSLANETPVSEARTAFLRRLAVRARALDPTRLLGAAMEKRPKPGDPDTQIVDDPLSDSVDVMSFNEYVGWYDGTPEKCDRVRWEIHSDKPVIVSEFGGDALQGRHGTRDDRWTEEYQAYLYERNLAMLDRIPGLSGMSPWVLVDFRSPRRVLPGIEDGFNRKGLVSSDGLKKAAFFVLQKYYSERAAAIH